MSGFLLTEWRDRMHVMDRVIADHIDQINRLSTGIEDQQCSQVVASKDIQVPLPRAGTFSCLYTRLRSFAGNLVDLFLDAFDTKQNYDLLPSQDYPPDYVLSVLMHQIATDISVIQRAMNQRLSGTWGMRDALQKADRLAFDALKPAMSLLPENTTVLTYFQKSPNIRLIPYADVALIGLPVSCLEVPQDYLAILHEVGHFVFWKASGLRETESTLHAELKVDLPQTRSWCYRWGEELFADIYGCIVGGPVIAQDFQDYQLRASMPEFTEDDGEHPPSVLRPIVYNKVLSQRFPVWAGMLESRWEALIVGTPRDQTTFVMTNNVPRLIAEAISPGLSLADPDSNLPVDEAIEVILTKLAGMQTTNWWQTQLFNSLQPGDNLYAEFAAALDATPLDDPPCTDFQWLPWLRKTVPGIESSHDTGGLDYEVWKSLLYIGWTTEIETAWHDVD